MHRLRQKVDRPALEYVCWCMRIVVMPIHDVFSFGSTGILTVNLYSCGHSNWSWKKKTQCCPEWELGRKTQALLSNRWQQYSSHFA